MCTTDKTEPHNPASSQVQSDSIQPDIPPLFYDFQAEMSGYPRKFERICDHIKAFEDYASGMNLERTAADLNALGADRLRSDRPFDSVAVRRILSNENYVGDLHLQKQPPKDYLTKRITRNIRRVDVGADEIQIELSDSA